LNARARVAAVKPVPHPRVESAGSATCPLCGGPAQSSEGVVEAQIALLACANCRAFVMEKRLIDVVMNARAWNLRPVLRHVAFLSRAAQQAAAEGTVLSITSTNWIRLANEQQRLDAARRPPSRREFLAEVTYRSRHT